MRIIRAPQLTWLATLAVILSACSTSNLSFVQDERVTITAPRDRETVSLPLRLDWEVEDFEVGPGRGSFAVFIDRAPQPAGKNVASLFEDDDGCRGRPGCPDEAYLADHGVFVTTETSLTVANLPQLSSGGRRDVHEATIVLLDAEGRRVGESAWFVNFNVDRNRGR